MAQHIPHAIIDISKTTAVERALEINQIKRSTMNGTQLRVTALFNQTNVTLIKEWDKIKKILEFTESIKGGMVNNMYANSSEATGKKFICPMCKQEGQRVNEFGICRTKGCGGVRTEKSWQDLEETHKRKANCLLIPTQRTPKTTRIFWTDGSGKKRQGQHRASCTGWATVEMTQTWTETGPIAITQKHKWMGRSSKLDSVPRCEARAIGKTLEICNNGEGVHIHTDSLVTIQNLRTLIEGTEREKKELGNKDLLYNIINMARTKQQAVMIEWVKGHEDMAEAKHNWISKMKKQGNEWADEAAKQAITEGEEDEIIPTTEARRLIDKETGCRVDFKALAKLKGLEYKDKHIKELNKKTKGATHGQGQRNEAFYIARKLTFEAAMKQPNDIVNWVHMIATNRVDVREYLVRREEQIQGSITTTGEGLQKKLCPVCQVNGVKKIQTKEHLLAGDCHMTRIKITELKQAMEASIHKWKVSIATQKRLINMIKTKWEQVDTQNLTANMQVHVDSGELVGLWKDNTIQQAQAIVRIDNEEQDQYVKSQMLNLSSKLLKISAEVYRDILFYKEAMTTIPTETEIELHKKLQRERPIQMQRDWIRDMTQAQVRNIINRHYMITGYVMKRAMTANEAVEEKMQDWRQKRRKVTIDLVGKVKKAQQKSTIKQAKEESTESRNIKDKVEEKTQEGTTIKAREDIEVNKTQKDTEQQKSTTQPEK